MRPCSPASGTMPDSTALTAPPASRVTPRMPPYTSPVTPSGLTPERPGLCIDEFRACRAKKGGDRPVHLAVHVFSQPGDAQRGLRGQLRQSLDVGGMQVAGQAGNDGCSLAGRGGGAHAPIVRSLPRLRQRPESSGICY